MSRTTVGLAADRPTRAGRGRWYIAEDTDEAWVSDGNDWIGPFSSDMAGGSSGPLRLDQREEISVAGAGSIYFDAGGTVDNAGGSPQTLRLLPGGVGVPWSFDVTNPSEDNVLECVAHISLPGLTVTQNTGAPTAFNYQRNAIATAVDAAANFQHADSAHGVNYAAGSSFDRWLQPATMQVHFDVPAGATETIEVYDELGLEWDASYDFLLTPMTYAARAHVVGVELLP